MNTHLQVLHERRKVLQNPYAYCEELESFESVRRDRIRLENPYAHAEEAGEQARPIQRFDGIAQSAQESRHSVPRRSEIKLPEIVRELQLDLWTRRKALFGTDDIDPIEVLDPEIALEAQGFRVIASDSLGQFSTPEGVFKIAGAIDRPRRLIQVSRQFSPEIQKFTLAHELGHALLHQGAGLHRDRPIDGSFPVRDHTEREANRFATLFLMPSKQVQRIFEQIFGASVIRFDERATFGAGLRKNANIQRLAARRLASMTSYNGTTFVPLFRRFRVSVETMAIRLEELKLFVLSNNLDRHRT